MKTTTGPTSAPWVAHCGTKKGILIEKITDSGFELICFAEGVSEANAHLIACAPELLAQLQSILSKIPLKYASEVRAVIAKATSAA